MQTEKRSKDKLTELQGILTKLPIAVCCSTALPEFGVRWKEVARAVRSNRLPMQSSSVARVLCKYLAKTMPPDQLRDIMSRLRLKLAAIQPRTWHLVHLQDPLHEDPVSEVLETLPQRLLRALQKYNKNGMSPEVQCLMLDELVYVSVQLSSNTQEAAPLYAAWPAPQPVLLTSSQAAGKLLKAVAEGVGYASPRHASLHGSHIPSLLAVSEGAWGAAAEAPPYEPTPGRSAAGLDYTNRRYNRDYVDALLGPNPPLLRQLTIKATDSFYDPACFNKTISVTLTINSDNVASTLKSWVLKGGIAADSEFFKLIQKARSNKITYKKHDSGSD